MILADYLRYLWTQASFWTILVYMDSNSFSGDPSLQRLADDAMQDFPSRFSSREEWDAYNEMLAKREDSPEHRALHGEWDEEASRWTGSDPTGGFGQASFHFC